MKILLFSDSHGHNDNMLDVVRHNRNVDRIWHCGDVQNGDDWLIAEANCPVEVVKGNCDFDYSLSNFFIETIASKRFLVTHGHAYLMYGVDALVGYAKQNNADVVVFGHTHKPYDKIFNGVRLINPGSISRPRQYEYDGKPTYAILEIDDSGNVSVEIKTYDKR